VKVDLIDYTKNALELLIFSKKTRLLNDASDYHKIFEMSEEEKLKELNYVRGTINSSWEFVDYTFLITKVSRAFTHQIIRHRIGISFAQQAQRVVDASDFEYLSTGACVDSLHYHKGMDGIRENYKKCLANGVNVQDARGLLPTNVLTNILVKANLRTLNTIMGIRLCYKAQGEFQNVARAIRKEIINVHPWAESFLEVYCVDKGICAFPNYKECPVLPVLCSIEKSKGFAKKVWSETQHEAQPRGEINAEK